MENVKVKGAVSVTLLALGGLAGVAVTSNAGGSNSEPAAALEPKVRTEVIHKTIHRTKKADSTGAATAPPAASYTSTPASSYASPEASHVVPAATEPAAAVSSSSGSGGGYEADDEGEEHDSYESGESHDAEHEGGDDD